MVEMRLRSERVSPCGAPGFPGSDAAHVFGQLLFSSPVLEVYARAVLIFLQLIEFAHRQQRRLNRFKDQNRLCVSPITWFSL